MKERTANRGWLLVGLIIVLVFVFIVLSGLIFFLTEHRKVLSHQLNQARAVYLAEAGVMQALYDFRRTRRFELGEYVVDVGPPDNVFILGGEAKDFLLVNLIPTEFKNANRRCKRDGGSLEMKKWQIWNVIDKDSLGPMPTLEILQMVIEWDPDDGELVNRIQLDKRPREFNSCAGAKASGELIDLDNAPLEVEPEDRWNDNKIHFTDPDRDMDTKDWIRLTFIMSDGTKREATWYNPSSATPTVARFTVKSVGEARQGTFPFVSWRRLEAEYEMITDDYRDPGTITIYRELSQKTP